MAEYWKSLPRKFCDICKCWFADNKASIDFHERGKRHQENAQKRIQEIQKRGIKDYKKQQQLENEMEKIEKAALAAYEKDLKNLQGGDTQPAIQPSRDFSYSAPESNVKYTAKTVHKKLKNSIKTSKQNEVGPLPEVETLPEVDTLSEDDSLSEDVSPPGVNSPPEVETPPEVESPPQKVWYEAMSDEGYKYYWNAVTSESVWEPPEEGFISIEEQNQSNSETVSEEQQSSEDTETTSKEIETNSDDVPCSIGPQPKVDPYGQWVTVEKEMPVEYDLQLPEQSENTVEVVIPIHKEESSLKFKEKVIGSLSDTVPGAVTFKKRKNAGSMKKNTRQRFTDDD